LRKKKPPIVNWRRAWSTNLLESVSEEVKRRSHIVGMFHNDARIEQFESAVLLEQDEH